MVFNTPARLRGTIYKTYFNLCKALRRKVYPASRLSFFAGYKPTDITDG